MFWQPIPNRETRGSIGMTSGLMSTLTWTLADPVTFRVSLQAGLEYLKQNRGYGAGAHTSADVGIGIRF